MLAQRLRRCPSIQPTLFQRFVPVGLSCFFSPLKSGGGPRVVVNTAASHARVRGSVPGLGGLKETKIVSSPSTCET